MRKKARYCTLLALLALLLNSTLLAAPGISNPAPVSSAVAGFDDQLTNVARQVPTFGGFYIDEQVDTLYVWTTDGNPTTAEHARNVLQQVLQRPLPGHRVAALLAKYRFTTLKAWHDRINAQVLSIPGVVLTDIGDRTNRLTVGVENPALQGPLVEAELARQGVPREAVVLKQTEPIRETATVRDSHRPILGGIQGVWVDLLGGGFICTIGFVAVRSGVTGFVSNSHCTDNFGFVDAGDWYQPSPGPTGGNVIGQESVDPPTFTGGVCPSGKVCRRSDANFNSFYSGVSSSRGFIAKPALNSINWNGTDTFRITAKAVAVDGDPMNFVGRTSGWKSGNITGTCVNVDVTNTNRRMLCQDIFNVPPQGGDSGSPVFKRQSGNDVWLNGILWGGNSNIGVSSSITYVQSELGTLTVCASGFSC